ncbi:energy-coupling factor ABC transporter ATP-binding protein [Microbacterium sp. NPDC003461]
MTAPGIEVRGLGVAIDGARILRDVTVSLPQRRIAVIGANGSGKSTFARTLNGLVAPSEGTVRVAGIDVAREPRRAREAVGFLFTNPDAQLLMPTPIEDLSLSLRAAGASRREVAAEAMAALERFGLAERADQPSYSLSGGQKQLLALAAVLVRRPRVVVADEPTTLLDLGNARRMARLLLEGDERGPVADQVVIVTHDLELAARCDVALRFAGGRLAETGEPEGVIDRYRAEFP